MRRDAIVIGGGIHGCSTALHLCLRNLRPVLLERDYAARHASGVNAGGVRPLARDPAEIPLSIRSMDLWEEVQDLVGDCCGFERNGQVLVAENGLYHQFGFSLHGFQLGPAAGAVMAGLIEAAGQQGAA